MDAQRFEALAVAIERDRRIDVWFSVVTTILALAGFIYLRFFHLSAEQEQSRQLLRSALGSSDTLAAGTVQQVIDMSALSTTLSFGALLLAFLVPWMFGRYRRRHDQALVELLRAQSKSQASSP